MEMEMEFTHKSCRDFVEILASKEPVPGGGGASALVGALSAALGNMVGNLTVGKKKYADVEAEIIEAQKQCTKLQNLFCDLLEDDARSFAPLAEAYKLPRTSEEEKAHRAEVIEAALREACKVPLQIMETCAETIDLMEIFANKGSRIAVSDAGVGAALGGAALEGAALNVFINTKTMQDRALAQSLNDKAQSYLQNYLPKARRVYQEVLAQLLPEAN